MPCGLSQSVAPVRLSSATPYSQALTMSVSPSIAGGAEKPKFQSGRKAEACFQVNKPEYLAVEHMQAIELAVVAERIDPVAVDQRLSQDSRIRSKNRDN